MPEREFSYRWGSDSNKADAQSFAQKETEEIFNDGAEARDYEETESIEHLRASAGQAISDHVDEWGEDPQMRERRMAGKICRIAFDGMDEFGRETGSEAEAIKELLEGEETYCIAEISAEGAAKWALSLDTTADDEIREGKERKSKEEREKFLDSLKELVEVALMSELSERKIASFTLVEEVSVVFGKQVAYMVAPTCTIDGSGIKVWLELRKC